MKQFTTTKSIDLRTKESNMKKYILLIGIPALLLLLAACNQADDQGATAADSTPAATTATADASGVQEPASAAPSAPITLASGEKLDVISVGFFDENMRSLDGLVAIEGRVKECFTERGALILIDSSVEAGCTDGCCPEAEVPVRLDMANYTGELPAADAEVVIVGDLTVQELGYELAVREIRQGDQLIVTAKT
jgi:hypothetical protein